MATALDIQLVHAFDTAFPGEHHPPPLRRIEMRVSVPSGIRLLPTLRTWLDGIRDHLQSHHHSQAGLVFHLLKRGDDERAAQQAFEKARRLGGVLKDYPNLRPFIIGVDSAGDERRSPPRLFGKAYDHLRRLQLGHRIRPYERPIRLGWTYHVGEDVDDLLTGLRHLDEVASLILGKEGGRLGHTLVLGEDPTRFYQRRGGQTEPTLGSHLLDLVWACGRLIDARQVDNCPWLENRIRTLGFSGQRRVPRIMECYHAMGLGSLQQETIRAEKELLKILRFRGDVAQPIMLRADQHWLDLVSRLQGLQGLRWEDVPS